MFTRCRCTRCQHLLRVLACHEGTTLRCPGCDTALRIPAGSASEEAPAAPEAKCVPVRTPEPRRLLPWVLLAPAVLAVVLRMWVGHGVLWAGVGVVLGGLFLLLGQRGRWPLSVRVGVSLSLATLGHSLTLTSPLLSAPEKPQRQDDMPPLLSLHLPPVDRTSVSPPAGTQSPRSGRKRRPQRPPIPDLQPAARLGELLSVSVFPSAQGDSGAFVTTADGYLKEFSYPDFQLRATYRLERTGYRAAADARRRTLWLAACESEDLRTNRHGDQPLGRADLHVYDVPGLATAKNATPTLHPRRVLPLGGDVLELLISPDQAALFYLLKGDGGTRLGRIDTERQVETCSVALSKSIRALCLTADGKTLYAAGAGVVLVLDPLTLKTRRAVEVEMDVRSVAANNAGCVYLAAQGQWTHLARLDLRGEQPELHRWPARLHGRLYLKMAPDQYRLYAGTSSAISEHLESLLLRGHQWKTPLLLPVAASAAQGPLRGEFFLTPDGRFLINRWGSTFRLAQGETLVPPVDLSQAH